MELEKVKKLLGEHKEDVMSFSSKEEKLDAIISLFGRAFPAISAYSAVYGPVFNMMAVSDYSDSQTIINALMGLKNTKGEALFVGNYGGDDLAEILDYIQAFIA